jgi:hypothetical protein
MKLHCSSFRALLLTPSRRSISSHPFTLYFDHNERYKNLNRHCDHHQPLDNKSAHINSSHKLQTDFAYLDSLSAQYGLRDAKTLMQFNYLRSYLPSVLTQLTKEEMLKLIYLYSLFTKVFNNDTKQCKNLDVLIDHLSKNLKRFLTHYSLIELSILCESLFKLKITLDDASVSLIVEEVMKKQTKEEADNYSLVALSKLLRISHTFSENNIQSIANQVLNKIENFNFTELCHILALFANFTYYDTNLTDIMFKKGLVYLEEAAESDLIEIRCKDVSRFWWSIACLNLPLQDLNYIINLVTSKISSQFYTYPHTLIDYFKSLILIGYYPLTLVDSFLNDLKFIEKLIASKREKVRTDLYFVLESIKIEHPYFELKIDSRVNKLARCPAKNNFKMLNRTKFFNLVYSSLQKKDKTEIVYPLDHFTLPSLSNNGQLYEILDSYVCLRNVPYQPSGLLNCKIRQMCIKGVKFQVIKSLAQLDLD